MRGLRGQLRIELLTDRPEERFVEGAVLYPEGAQRGLTIAEAVPVADGPGWWLRFREVRDRDAADALRGVYLEIDTPDEPREPGRWLVHELEGLAVRSGDGEDLGRIVELYHAGGADVFVVRGPRGELDVPGVRGHRHRARARAGRDDRRPRRARHRRATGRRGLRPAEGPPAAEPPPSKRERAPRRRPRTRPSAETGPERRRVRAALVMTLEVDVLTLFPAMVEGPLGESIPARILERGLATVRVHDLRQWGLGKHRTVDDYTYGGGAGMVLRPEPVASALAELRRPGSLVILLDPAGEVFRQSTAQSLASAGHLVLVCPRYEGVDERIRSMVDLELSIGDYVLTGGELAALVVVDAVLRLLPGAIDEASTAEESFAAGLLEYPQYTRPATFDGVSVPPVLVSGHHEEVRRWRLRESLRRTLLRRPDLLLDRPLSPEEGRLLDEIRAEPDESASAATASAPGDASGDA